MMGQVLKGKRGAPDGASPSALSRDLDFYGWTRQQADFLRAGDHRPIDAVAIAEELIDLGNSEYDKLESNLRIVLLHMIKWDHQPERRSRSWGLSIREHRRRVQRVLKVNPSLTSRLTEALAEAYQDARDEAAMETGHPLRRFPEVCPYDWRTVTERDFEIDPPDAI
jgi:hypothetical protein